MLTTWVCSAIPSRSRYLRSDYITCTILPGYASVLDTCIDSEVQMKTGFAAVHRHTRPSLSPIRCPKLLLCGTYTGERNHTVIDSTIWRSIEANHVQACSATFQRISMILPCRSYIIWADIIAETFLAKHIWYVSTNDVLSYQALLREHKVSYLSSRIPRSYYAAAHFDSISARHPARLVLTSLGIEKLMNVILPSNKHKIVFDDDSQLTW